MVDKIKALLSAIAGGVVIGALVGPLVTEALVGGASIGAAAISGAIAGGTVALTITAFGRSAQNRTSWIGSDGRTLKQWQDEGPPE